MRSIAWPTVALIAIAALFLIARQAIGSGHDLDISWKVTEKVAGRVTITKVTRGRNRRPATPPGS